MIYAAHFVLARQADLRREADEAGLARIARKTTQPRPIRVISAALSLIRALNRPRRVWVRGPHPLKPPDVVLRQSSNSTGCGVGWRGRIRTFDLLIQSQAPYRLATRQWSGSDDTAG
jgi:hypothetical protein